MCVSFINSNCNTSLLSLTQSVQFSMSAAVADNILPPKKSFGLRRREERGEGTASNETKIGRQLRIKTGIVKRLAKDVISYQTEADIQQERLDKMLKEKRDEYDVKKMGQVVQESLMMIPHCLRRLKIANEDLRTFTEEQRTFIGEKANEKDSKDDQETELEAVYKAAELQIIAATAIIQSHEKEAK